MDYPLVVLVTRDPERACGSGVWDKLQALARTRRRKVTHMACCRRWLNGTRLRDRIAPFLPPGTKVVAKWVDSMEGKGPVVLLEQLDPREEDTARKLALLTANGQRLFVKEAELEARLQEALGPEPTLGPSSGGLFGWLRDAREELGDRGRRRFPGKAKAAWWVSAAEGKSPQRR